MTIKGLCNPIPSHHICSAHFPGGKKTYQNNTPTILAIPKPHTDSNHRTILNVEDEVASNNETLSSPMHMLDNEENEVI